jgi:hypothetical protein
VRIANHWDAPISLAKSLKIVHRLIAFTIFLPLPVTGSRSACALDFARQALAEQVFPLCHHRRLTRRPS